MSHAPDDLLVDCLRGVEDHMEGGGGPGRSMSNREMQMLLRREGGEEGRGVDCCPSVLEMVEPEGGKNADDMYVELFRDGDKRQRFYELSCRQDVEGKPCRFMDRRLHNQSRCVQKYSYSYAIVRDSLPTADSADQQRHHHHHHNNNQHLSKSFPSFSSSSGGSDWMLDYIKIRSGCSCEVMPKAKKKRSNRGAHRNSTGEVVGGSNVKKLRAPHKHITSPPRLFSTETRNLRRSYASKMPHPRKENKRRSTCADPCAPVTVQ
uniref:(California timema) hypothetical protein n=1 Tax=Timema californicum TaxID=61474 RepID=A0A7R9JH02_TIMCA|nr:unnamed protein product [Timema californicum]